MLKFTDEGGRETEGLDVFADELVEKTGVGTGFTAVDVVLWYEKGRVSKVSHEKYKYEHTF